LAIWRIGASVSALISLGALATMVLMGGPTTTGKAMELSSIEIYDFGAFEAWFPVESPECSEFDSCVFLGIRNLKPCSLHILVEFTVTDEKDNYLSTQSLVIQQSDFTASSPLEIGTDIQSVGYFTIDQILCSNSPETVIRRV